MSKQNKIEQLNSKPQSKFARIEEITEKSELDQLAAENYLITETIATTIKKDWKAVCQIHNLIEKIIKTKGWKKLRIDKMRSSACDCYYDIGTDAENFQAFIEEPMPYGLGTSVETLIKILEPYPAYQHLVEHTLGISITEKIINRLHSQEYKEQETKESQLKCHIGLSKFSYILKISLRDLPQIWRVIEIPGDYSFWELHLTIQAAMGWRHEHLHSFTTGLYSGKKDFFGEEYLNHEIGIPQTMDCQDYLPSWEIKVKNIIYTEGTKFLYTYDFGDNWYHVIEVLKIQERDLKSAKVIGGEKACPPENCGSSEGYERLLKILDLDRGNVKNENSWEDIFEEETNEEELKDYLEWLEKCGYENYNPNIYIPLPNLPSQTFMENELNILKEEMEYR